MKVSKQSLIVVSHKWLDEEAEQPKEDMKEDKIKNLLTALEKIAQMSDPGSYERAIVDMKAIAVNALKEFQSSAPDAGVVMQDSINSKDLVIGEDLLTPLEKGKSSAPDVLDGEQIILNKEDLKKLLREAYVDATGIYEKVHVNDWWGEFKMRHNNLKL